MSEDVKEISFDELGLTKPLEKMTAKELRAMCMSKLPMITGVSGMDKSSLVAQIKEVFGIVDDDNTVSPYKDQIFEIKRQIRSMRTEKLALDNRGGRSQLRRKINKLKKRTRRLSRAL